MIERKRNPHLGEAGFVMTEAEPLLDTAYFQVHITEQAWPS